MSRQSGAELGDGFVEPMQRIGRRRDERHPPAFPVFDRGCLGVRGSSRAIAAARTRALIRASVEVRGADPGRS